MANLAYREVYTMNPTETRKLLIKAYHETKSISKTARMWKTSRDVIRKWVRPPRGAEGPPSGLGPPGRRPSWRPARRVRFDDCLHLIQEPPLLLSAGPV